jgi:hypothetical protein
MMMDRELLDGLPRAGLCRTSSFLHRVFEILSEVAIE